MITLDDVKLDLPEIKLPALEKISMPCRKHKGGRPSKMTKLVLAKLCMAFGIDASDGEACLFAGINPATLYRYQRDHPEFCEQKAQFRTLPVLKARYTIYKSLDKPRIAMWYLGRKMPHEFGRNPVYQSEAATGEMTPEHKKRVEEILRRDGV